MSKPAKKAKTTKKDVALLEDTLREAPFVPDEGPGDSLLALPGGTRSRGVSPGAFAAIKAALEQCAEEVGADFGPEERQWINRIRDGALRRLEPDVAAARREAKRRLLAELAQEAAEERAKLAELRLQTARARDEVAACRAVAAAMRPKPSGVSSNSPITSPSSLTSPAHTVTWPDLRSSWTRAFSAEPSVRW